MKNKQTLVIIGGRGFIGQHVLSYARSLRDSIQIESISSTELSSSGNLSEKRLKNLFTTNTNVLILSGVKPSRKNDLEAFNQNIQIISSISSVLLQYPVKRVVYVSSAAVYGEDIQREVISESTQVEPRSYYGIAKYTSECVLSHVCLEQGISFLAVRPPVVYGPGDTYFANSPSGFIYKITHNQGIPIYGDGKEIREFMYIDDVAAILYQLMFRTDVGVLNVVSGKSYSYLDIVQTLRRAGCRNIHIQRVPRTKHKVNIMFDPRLIRTYFPTFNFTSLEDGITKILATQSP